MNQFNFNVVYVLLLFIGVIGCSSKELPFTISGQDAFKHVAFLADSIGARVTGSDEDRLTRDYIAGKMNESGLNVERQRVSSVWVDESFQWGGREYTVHSENVIGILPGKTERTILISGHFDSWGRSSPGANDNASAIGVLLEVARAVKDHDWNSTIIFAAFCAEERGLLGSQYFVGNTDLSNLVFAMNLDPVGYGDLFISPIPGTPPLGYQREFMRLARKYGINNAAVDPVQIIVPRYVPLGFGADHKSFLNAGYNAFSVSNTLIGWNYHSTHDKSVYINPATLEAAASMVIAFLLEYDDNKEPPMLDTPVYIAQPIMGNYYVFITQHYLLIIVSLSFIAFLYFGIKERHILKQINIFDFIILFLKMLLFAIIQVLFLFLPVFGGMILEQTLYPWMANPLLYMMMGLASGMVGLFFIIQIAKLIGLNPGERQLKYWAVLILLFYTLVAVVFVGLDIAYYFAAPLLLFLLSFRIRGTMWLLLIGGVGIFPLFGSFGPTHISMLITLLGVTVPVFTLMGTVFILAFPFIFYFASAVLGEDQIAAVIRKSITHTATPAIAMLCFIGFYYWSHSMDVYHEDNPQLITQSAFFDLNADAGTLVLASYDYLPVLYDEVSGQYIEPDGITVQYPLELDPGLTDFLIESEAFGDTLILHLSMSEPEVRDYISIRLSSREQFNVIGNAFDELRIDRYSYQLDILSAEGEFKDTLMIARTAPVLLQFSIHTFDVSEQPVLREVVHPLAFRYYQRMNAIIEIE